MNPYVEAVALLRKGKKKEAELAFSRLLDNDFDNPVLLFALGMAYVSQRKNGIAFALLRRSLERIDEANEAYTRLGIFPDSATPEGKRKFIRQQKLECLNGIALCHRYENRRDEARRTFEKALTLSPDDADTHANIGCMYVNNGDPEGGIKWLKKCLELNPKHDEAHWNLGLLQLELGQWKEGFANYDEGSKRKHENARIYQFQDGKCLEKWQGEPSKRILAYGEQGIGDEIMFASCVPDLKFVSEQVVLDCHPRLVTLFERSFGLKCHGTRKEEWLDWPQNYTFDARVAMGSLPRYFRANGEFPRLPYLKTGRNAVVDALPGFKVGIHWAGGYKETHSNLRSIPLDEFAPLLRMGASFVSLQYTPVAVEIEHASHLTGAKITEFDFITDKKSDYDLTAEVVNSLDLVITVNTSVVHLAGALGKECWTLTPDKPAWRYTVNSGEEMPWYGSVRQFRQAKGEKWSAVIGRVARALEERIGSKEALAA